MPVVLARKKLTFDSSSCRLLRVALLARPAITFHNNIFTSTASFRTTVEATRRLRLTHTRSQKRCRTRRQSDPCSLTEHTYHTSYPGSHRSGRHYFTKVLPYYPSGNTFRRTRMLAPPAAPIDLNRHGFSAAVIRAAARV